MLRWAVRPAAAVDPQSGVRVDGRARCASRAGSDLIATRVSHRMQERSINVAKRSSISTG